MECPRQTAAALRCPWSRGMRRWNLYTTPRKIEKQNPSEIMINQYILIYIYIYILLIYIYIYKSLFNPVLGVAIRCYTYGYLRFRSVLFEVPSRDQENLLDLPQASSQAPWYFLFGSCLMGFWVTRSASSMGKHEKMWEKLAGLLWKMIYMDLHGG